MQKLNNKTARTNNYQPLPTTTNNLLEDIKLLEDDIASEKKMLLFQKKINLSAFQSWMVAPGDFFLSNKKTKKKLV